MVNHLFDILLSRPFPKGFYSILEFLFFVFHFFFVLLTLGTALFGILAVLWRKQNAAEIPHTEPATSHSSMPVYFASKSLTITFGIAVLLLVVAYYSVPFVAAANLNALAWMAITVLLLTAFVLLEFFDRRSHRGETGTIALGIAGLAVLCMVPAVFVAFVVSAENPERWAEIFRSGVLVSSLALHWLIRLGHVFGAAIVITALFFYVFRTKAESRFAVTPRLLFGALMVQIVLGIVLYMTLPQPKGFVADLFVVLGAAAAMALAWLLFTGRPRADTGRWLPATMIVVILLPMLLARQVLQENVLKPFDAQLQKNALQYKATLAAAPPLAENQFIEEKYDDYNLPQFMFQQSCAFCHGGVGNGQGIEAGNLKIAPADLTQVCTRPHSLMALLRTGIPGTAMPYFSVYTDDALRGLIRYLYQNVGVSKLPAPVVPEIPSEEEQVAATVFAEQCASCHGADGKISAKGKALLPAPLSMREWALQPAASYNVITNGYPGTAMKGFAHLPEQVRRALVKYVNDLYNGRHR